MCLREGLDVLSTVVNACQGLGAAEIDPAGSCLIWISVQEAVMTPPLSALQGCLLLASLWRQAALYGSEPAAIAAISSTFRLALYFAPPLVHI